MADLILTMVVSIGFGFLAEVTSSDDFVKNEVLSLKFILQPLLFYLVCIVDDSALKVPHVGKSIMLEPGTRLLTPNAASTVQCHFFVLVYF